MATLSTEAPGPRGNWLLGSLGEVRRDPLGLFTSSAATYGDVVRFRFGPATAFLLRSADAFKQVLVDDHRNFTKDTNGYRALRVVLGNGLVTSQGDFWLRQRRIAQPAFHRQKITAIGTIVTEEGEKFLQVLTERARQGESFDAFLETMATLSRVTGRALLGTDVGDETSELGAALSTVLHIAAARAMSVVQMPTWLPTPQNFRLRAAVRVLDRFIYGVIEERRAKGVEGDDLLSMLMTARDEETGETMSPQQLRDEVLTLFSAGYETTATGLAWAFYFLSENPSARETLGAELDSVLGGRLPTATDLPALPYCRRVIDESMRLRPPIWNVARRVQESTTIGGYEVPAGSLVFCCAYVAHRNPNAWEDPERFDPDRFLPERLAKVPKLAYLPFSTGPRVCIGNTLSVFEQHLMLATIAQRFELTMAPGHPVVEQPLLVLRPRDGLRMTARARSSQSASAPSR